MAEPHIRAARTGDFPPIERLLTGEQLPLFEAERFLDTFWVAESEGELVGCVALEVYEHTALLRSIVAATGQRGTGLGGRLTRTAIEQAKGLGVHQLYLFTMNAAPFFSHIGFEPCTMEDFAEPARRSTQYSGLLAQPDFIQYLTPMRLSL